MLAYKKNKQNLFSWFPKMEKTTFDVSLVHFLLMFGYKLFSLYYPLFLISIGFSILNIGSIYLLTYSVIAVSSLVINHYIHKFSAAKIASVGIFGYGVFALMMLLSRNIYIFYLAQIVLGFSAAAWLVSLKFILMKAKNKNKRRSFGWFYSMPHYASAIAPVIGGLVIWKFGFIGVFALSVIIQFSNAIYAYTRLNGNDKKNKKENDKPKFSLKTKAKYRYKEVFKIIKSDSAFFLILFTIFASLVLGGIYRTFFVIFLKDLSFSQEEIIKLVSLASLLYLPVSLIVIKLISKIKDAKIISGGIATEGITTIIFGLFAFVSNFASIFFLFIFNSMGALAAGSGKSSLLSKKLHKYREEASTIDTILTTLGPAFGGLLGGILISYYGYQFTFLIGGTVVSLLGLMSFMLRIKK